MKVFTSIILTVILILIINAVYNEHSESLVLKKLNTLGFSPGDIQAFAQITHFTVDQIAASQGLQVELKKFQTQGITHYMAERSNTLKLEEAADNADTAAAMSTIAAANSMMAAAKSA